MIVTDEKAFASPKGRRRRGLRKRDSFTALANFVSWLDVPHWWYAK